MKPQVLFLLVFLSGRTLADVDATRLAAPADLTLFTIHRSLNRNTVIYEADPNSQGFAKPDPIRIYWVMHEKGGITEPLTSFEMRYAYGITIRKGTFDEVQFSLKALPDRILKARRSVAEGRVSFRTETKILNRDCILKKVFIQSEGSGLLPSVKFTEISGNAIDDGTPLAEKIEKK